MLVGVRKDCIMRIRALLFIPALAAAALAIGVSNASAATLFTTTAHSTRVTVGATADATSQGPIILTSGGSEVNRCTHSSLGLRLDENSHARVSITVTSSTFTNCSGLGGQATGTHTVPWQLTITGNGAPSGSQTRWAATVHRVAFDFALIASGVFTGNLETGVTATQPTVGTSPICVDLNAAGTVAGPGIANGSIDGRYCLTGAGAAFSLTN
jgi:hypothetical protein